MHSRLPRSAISRPHLLRPGPAWNYSARSATRQETTVLAPASNVESAHTESASSPTADRHRGFRILFVSSSRLAALDRMLETHLERWTAEHPLSRLGPVAFDGYLASFAQGFYELRPDAARAVRELTGRHPYFSAAILWELQKAGVGTASAQDVQKVALAAAKTLGPYFKGLVDDLDPAERVLLAAAADGARKDVRRFTAEVLLECCPLVGHMGTPKYLKKRLDALVERWLLGRDDDGYGFESTLLAILAQTHLPPLDKLLRGEAELVFRAFPFHRASEVLRELELDAEGLSVAEPRLPDVADAAKAWRGLSEGPESPDATTRNAGKLLDPVRRVLGTSRVNHGVRSGLYVETQDLGLAGRAFPDRVSFVVRPGGPPEPGEFDALTEAVQTARGKEGQDLAFLLTADHHRRFRKHMKQKLGSNLVVLGSGELRDLLLHPDPAAYLIKDLIAPQIGVEGLIPYETRGPVSARMFYGRAHDVRRVLGGLLGRSRRGYAVHGPRRIGKTSLLRRVEEELRRTGRAFPVLIDCSTLEGDLGWAVVSRLRGRGRLFYKTQGLEACLRNVSSLKGVPVVLLLDEIDSILAAERQDNWPLINSLRQSFNQDQCGVVVAGFRDLYDELHDQGSPLYNFLEPLALQKLPDGDARKLVEEPMQELRIEFEERAAFIDRVLELSGALPSQVQLFCRRVAERLFEEGRYQATVDDVTEVLWNEGVRQSLRATFEKNTTKLEQLLCYVVWDRLPLMEKEIYEVLVRRSVQVEPDEVARACTGLWLANILARGHGGLLHPASGAMANVIGEAAKQKGGLVMQQVRKTRGK